MNRTTARRLTLAVVISLFVYALACYSPIGWSPDGKYVAFVQFNQGEKNDVTAELWVVDVASGRGERIDSSKAGLSAPAWSPDGGKIAYIRVAPEALPEKPKKGAVVKGSIVVYDMAAKKRVQLCAAAAQVDGDEFVLGLAQLVPSWSPDGKMIAFDHVEAKDRRKVMMADLKGNTKLVLENAMYPQWSPDGLWIACLAEAPGPIAGMKIAVVRADGSDKRTIAEYTLVDYDAVNAPMHIAWAPNSRQIVYTSRVSPLAKTYGLFLADLDGKKAPLVTGKKAEELGNPAISADGKQVAFVRWQEDEEKDTGEFAIVSMDVMKGKERVLARIPGKERGQVASLSWSPDGTWLAYRWQMRVIRLIRSDGSQQKDLVADPTSLAVLVSAYAELAETAHRDAAYGESRKSAKLAVTHADDFARRFPTSRYYGDAMISKARCLLMLNRPQDAADVLDSISFPRPNPEAERQAQFELAECHVALGQYRDALAIWGGLAELFRKDPVGKNSRKRIKEIEQSLEKAQKLTEQLAEKKNAARYLELADVYAGKLLNPKKATKALQGLLKEFPDSKEAGKAKDLLKEIRDKFAKE